MSKQTDKRPDAWFATAFSMGPVILTITRLATGQFVEVNERFLSTTGYTRSEVLGRTPLEIGLWVSPGQRAEGLSRLREGQSVREVETEFRMKDGAIRTCLMSGELIDFNGEPCVLTALTDITERRQAEAERAELLEREHAARAAAEAAVRIRDTFLSTAAHELKTPLTVLIGNIQLLQRRQKHMASLPEPDERLLRIIGEQAARLNRLIGAMLDISRLQTGQLTIMYTPLDVIALVRRVADDMRPTLVSHTLMCSLPDAPLMIQGDELRLEQVLQNLLSNAVKYSPGGGPIAVRVERQGDRVVIAITDQGIGIPEANLPQLFERFYRADNVDQHQIGGMGIGLFVVRAIVERHGGQVGVESSEAGGSTFTVSLPINHDFA
jgi:PAS domain S-box-containing protein